MANLNLTHSGNMNINSASINSQGQIEVDYAPNTTGKVTGWTTNPEGIDGTYEPGESLTVRFTPQFSGTVLTETFTVSGVDVAGVQRSDSATLRQIYNNDLRTYNIYVFERECTVNSSSVTENYVEFNITMPSVTAQTYADLIVGVNGGSSTYWGAYVAPPTPGPDTGSTTASTLNIVVADSITGTGRASATYTPSNAVVSLRYSISDTSKAVIDAVSGEITVISNGNADVCVYDEISQLSSCKSVNFSVSQEELIDSIEIIVSSTIRNSGYAYTSFSPVDSVVDLHYSSSNEEIATIDEYTGKITVLQNGVVSFTVTDNNSGLSSTKEVNVIKTEESYSFVVYYDVTSTTTPTWIKFEEGECWYPECPSGSRANSKILSATLEDDTVVPLDADQDGNIYYTFPTTGVQKIIYTVDDNRIPANAFSTVNGPYEVQLIAVEAPGMTEIGWDAFFNVRSLTSITMPDVTYLGQGCFGGAGLTGDLVLPDGIEEVNWSFSSNYQLTSITFPSTIKSIAGFESCYNIKYFKFLGETPPDYFSLFLVGSNDYFILVPCDSLETYRESSTFQEYKSRIFCQGSINANYIQLDVDDSIIGSATASTIYYPSMATIIPQYYSSNPEVVSVEPFTGILTVISDGTSIITCRDVLTNLTDSKEITAATIPDPEEYRAKYLTFEIINGGSIMIYAQSSTAISIKVRKNGGSWENKTISGNSNVSVSVASGDILEFTADINEGTRIRFGSSGATFNVSGNLMSITLGSYSWQNSKTLGTNYLYRNLFADCSGIVDAKCLLLPATRLSNYCYVSMFQNCVNLTKSPMIMAEDDYSTTSRPASGAFNNMFNGCSSLSYIYCRTSFKYSSSTTRDNWLSGVAEKGIYVKRSGVDGDVPSGWTVVDVT